MQKVNQLLPLAESFLLAFCTLLGCSRNQSGWPEVMPVTKTFHFAENQTTSAELKIVGKDQKPLYLLECYLNAFDRKDSTFDYTGVLECRLTSLYEHNQAHRTLLSDQQPQLRDWHNRGVFHIEELVQRVVDGEQIEYPGFGKVRQFGLRGMNLTLKVMRFTVDSGSVTGSEARSDRIKQLDLEINVTPDSGANTATAAPLTIDHTLNRRAMWPHIAPLERTLHLKGHERAKLEIANASGFSLYILQCILNPTDEDSDKDHFDYSGALECRFTSTYDNRHSTLLSENLYATRDWESRGRFLVEEITGPCANYPDYGRTRYFKLRGMSITLVVDRLKLLSDSGEVGGPKRGPIQELDLHVKIVPDSTVLTEIAEPTRYANPVVPDPKDPNRSLRNCDTVRMK